MLLNIRDNTAESVVEMRRAVIREPARCDDDKNSVIPSVIMNKMVGWCRLHSLFNSITTTVGHFNRETTPLQIHTHKANYSSSFSRQIRKSVKIPHTFAVRTARFADSPDQVRKMDTSALRAAFCRSVRSCARPWLGSVSPITNSGSRKGACSHLAQTAGTCCCVNVCM